MSMISRLTQLYNIFMALLCPFMAKKDSDNFIIFVPQKEASHTEQYG